MTLRELAERLKQAQAQDLLETLRQVLSDAGIGEYTVYRPTERWKTILTNLNVTQLEPKTVCATIYNADASIFEKVKTALNKKYKAVFSTKVDDLGYRQLFAVGDSAEKEPQMIVCINFYEEGRESVKAQYRQEEDATNSDTDDLELEL